MSRTVTLSDEAYALLCGLVHPTDVIDPDDVRAADAAWNEARALFPFADYVDPDADDAMDHAQGLPWADPNRPQ